MRKTLEQERAFYCLKCVERLKLAKVGKWFELGNLKEYNLKPEKIEELWSDKWKKMRFFDGVKREFSNSMISQFLSEFKKKLKEENSKIEQDYDYVKKIDNYVKSGNENLCDDIKRKLESFYSEFSPKYPNYLSDYSSHAKRLSQMIISNGLIPTLAFYKSKGDDRGQIYTDVCEIMEITGFKPYKDWKYNKNKEGSFLLEFLLDTDYETLRLATTEALAIANWLKRIVEVEIEE